MVCVPAFEDSEKAGRNEGNASDVLEHPSPNLLRSALTLLEPISRIVTYFKRHGFRATLERALLFLRRFFSENRMVLFYLDLPKGDAIATTILPVHLTVQRVAGFEDIDGQDWQQITDFWNPSIYRRQLSKRFERGGSLWLIRSGARLAGFGWTMIGGTIEPHYHPLGANDVHLFDFFVFPEFRGQGINPRLVERILHDLAAEGRSRAFIEVREWNRPQLVSLAKTPFRRLGVARKSSLFGKTFVKWSANPEKLESQISEPLTEGETANHVGLRSR